MDFLKGWRTMILGVVVGLVGTIKAVATPEVAAEAPTPEEAQAAFDGVMLVYSWGSAIGIWVFRAITTSPIFKKEPPTPPPAE
jgi:hypothetical protein